MQSPKRIPTGGNVQSAERDRSNFVCVMGRDPERNKIARTHLWTGAPDAREFASWLVATMRAGKTEGKTWRKDTSPAALVSQAGIEPRLHMPVCDQSCSRIFLALYSFVTRTLNILALSAVMVARMSNGLAKVTTIFPASTMRL